MRLCVFRDCVDPVEWCVESVCMCVFEEFTVLYSYTVVKNTDVHDTMQSRSLP